MAFLESLGLEHETLADALEAVAADQPTAPALHVPGRSSLTYGDLGAQIRYVRERLGGWGIAPGHIVAGFMPSRPETAVACATFPSSCTFAPLGATLTTDAYAQLIARMGAHAVLVPKGQDHPISAAARQHDVAEIDVVSDSDAPAGLFTLDLHRKGNPLRATPAARPELAYILVSSGTTGRPKLVPSTHRQTLLYAKVAREWLQYSPSDVGCHLTPIHLGNGLRSGLINPLLAGLSIICLPESDVDAFFNCIEEFQPTCLNAGFTVHRAILRRAPEYREVLRQSRFRFLRSGAGRLRAEEIERLEQAFEAPVLVGFSSVEAAAISHDPLPPRRRKRGAAGLPLANEVAVMDNACQVGATGATGEIVVRGPLVFPGYLDDRELTAASFVGDWFRTGDLGRIDDEGYVHVTGRIKEIINRGGEKISPAEIDAVIESLPGVREAATFGIAHPSLGEEVVAAVVQQGDAAIDEAQVIEHVRCSMGPVKVPRRVYFVDRLPRTANGKVLRRELPHLLGLDRGSTAPGGDSGPAPEPVSLSPLEGSLAGLWASLLHIANVGRDDNFFLLGGDSLLGTQLLVHVKALFGVELPIQSLFGKAMTVAGMARTIETTRRRNTAIQKDTPAGAGRSVLAPIPRREARAPVFLTHAQWRAWFLARLDAGSTAYNEGRAHRLTGPIDLEALRGSLQALLQRHEILRTTFFVIDDEPRQIVHEDGALDLECVDLSAAPAAIRDEALSSLLTEVTQEPLNLESGPLARFRLIRLGGDEHVLLRVWHHIISDGWSTGIFERELSSVYNALVAGRAVELPPLALQYADYALWQRQWLSGEVLDRQLGYWKDKLVNLPTLELPTDHARPAVQSYRGARFEMALPQALAEALKALGRAQGATLFMTLLAAFQVLLHRYSGAEDIAVGTPIAGRRRAELEGLIGFFANTLVLRVSLADEPTFREVLARVRESALSAYTHQDVPFEKLVEELAPQRDLSRNPLFQVSFALQNAPDTTLALQGLQASRLTLPTSNAKFDLTLTLREGAEGLRASWEYCTDLFERATIERMAGHFQVLLKSIVAEPEQRIGRLTLLSAAERHRLLVEWNNTAAEYPREACIHTLFEAQAAKTPQAVAVLHEGTTLTYAELNARANHLAHYLRANGVGPQVLVGICMERSPELMVGLLGILKAGGAYVPLDPDLPRERLAFMLEDTAAKMVITQQGLLACLPETASPLLCLDRDWPQISSHSPSNPAPNTTSQHLAYVMYTSGSTGKPKGVAVPHLAISRLLINTNYVHLDSTDVVAQASNVSFDAAVFEIWGVLLHGARFSIITKDVVLSPRDFAAQIKQQGITTMFLTTALFNHLACDVPGAFHNLRQLLFGGEAVQPKWVKEVLRSGPPQRLLHMYGPTETATFASWYRVENVEPNVLTIPIGRPITNTLIYVLDRNLQPVPIGVPGELYIGGSGLARGYLNQPELTAEKFIRDPFSRETGARLYRTGDLGRFLSDGNIEFLGRIDDQVKIRGFRIELGEIEAVLAQHAVVHATAVVAREDTPGEKRLVAHVVFRHGQSADAGELRAFLKRKLPNYMLPSQFMFLEALPILPTGKVDRRALPAPKRIGSREETFASPRNEQEYQLVKIWEELLEVLPIGIRDDFFELGGNSLLAVRLIGRIEQVYGKKLDVSALFACATVEHLADAISKQDKDQIPSALVKVQPHGSRTPLFFLHGDYSGGGVYCLKLARYLGEEQPFYALQPLGLDGYGLPATIESMAEPYLEILRAVQPHGPYLLGGYCYGGLVAFEMARRLRARGEAVDLILIDALAKNVDFRVHDKLMAWASSLLNLDAAERLDSFLRLRRLAIHIDELSGVARWAAFLWGKAHKLKAAPKWLARAFRRNSRRYPQVTTPQPARIPESAADWERILQEKEAHYRRLTMGYVAYPYRGRITLIRATEHPHATDDPTLGWRQVASEVDLHVVPGDHATCVTKFLDIVAEHLKSSLDKLSVGSESQDDLSSLRG
jgi:amino acid adenylation domain-containing protein